ncbi:GNAT family N-acetyltransferase [Flavobacterium ardleyense]|uniref:GNAT family N-acetyltransferase n=1 Tax=Flavobacterium ardleyense TaxID=2038737 RepID=A0ABW5Z5T1_9FLAO
MKKYIIKKYQSEDAGIWNEFVANAKNATFLFHRDFMEYHKDRFNDFSLLVFDEKQNLKAILPANRVGETLFSHQGLTYGGLVFKYEVKFAEIIVVFKEILSFLYENAFLKLELKNIPTIYTSFPSDEMEYLLFILDAKKIRCDALSVIDLNEPIYFSQIRKRGIERGNTNKLVVKEENEFTSFWKELLIPNLKEKHNAKPVHSLQEIQILHSKFSRNIRQFNVYFENELVAGTTVFETKNVAHSQYISGLSKHNHLGGLDFLYHHLIKNVFADKKYFDFGISNENEGRNINSGLIYWKESLGARTIVQNFYTIDTKNYSNLENVLV